MSSRIRSTALLLLASIAAAPAVAATRLVDIAGTDFANDCLVKACRTVRYAVDVAKTNDLIKVGSGEFLETGTINVTKSLTITGAGSLSTAIILVVPGRVFDTAPNVAVNIIGVAIRGGYTEFGDGAGIRNRGHLALNDVQIRGNKTEYGYGGGIANVREEGSMATVLAMTRVLLTDNNSNGGGGLFNSSTADVSMTECYFLGNTSDGFGGAIHNGGKLKANRLLLEANAADQVGGGIYTSQGGLTDLRNATLTGNSTAFTGGAVYTLGSVLLTHVTIADNLATNGGGGVAVGSPVGHASLRNSIVANNTGPQCLRHVTEGLATVIIDGTGTVVSDDSCGLWPSANTVDDPKLGVFKHYGGFLPAYELLTGSPAIDFGTQLYGEGSDQRGFARPLDGDFDGVKEYDAGAFEYGAQPPAGSPQPLLPRGWYLGPWRVIPGAGGAPRR